MTPEYEVMAEALWVERNHADLGPMYVACQIGVMALRGDDAGIARWRRIAHALSCLRAGKNQ